MRWWAPALAAFGGLFSIVLALVAVGAGVSGLLHTCATEAPASASGIPADLVPDFTAAAAQFDLGDDGWAYLAAINEIESGFDDTSLTGVASGANSFGAAGPMQIGIGGAAGDTWSHVQVSGVPGGASPPSVYDELDAVYAAANMLHADGAPADWDAAIFDYNHASWYVADVASLAARFAGTPAAEVPQAQSCPSDAGAPTTPATATVPAVSGTTPQIGTDGVAAVPAGAPAQVQEMIAAGDELIDEPYSYGGGHSPASMTVPPDPAADPGEQENGAPGYDCSSAVDYLLWGAGLGATLLHGAVPASQALATTGQPGPGRWVTIYAGSSGGQAHAFIAVDGIVLDTVHLEPTTPSGTGPRWQPQQEVQRELADGSFVARHPVGL